MTNLMGKIIKFQDDRDWKQFHTPENLAKSISIEAAELLEHFQWNKEYDKDEVVDELADVLNYCYLLADCLNVDVEEIILNKMKKNEKKYPVNKSKGVSTKYDKL
jgi:dCTP diphosphatase